MVTPLRDGMNLVAKEYVAAQDPTDPGVLILSRFAGAAEELTEALIVNPFDADEIADAMHEALAMPLAERLRRHNALRTRVWETTASKYCAKFLTYLEQGKPGAEAQAAGSLRLGLALSFVINGCDRCPRAAIVVSHPRAAKGDHELCSDSCTHGGRTREWRWPLSACTDPYDPGQRAVGGGLLGAGTGAAIGGIAGGGRGAATGALIGGAVGAVGGAVTRLGRPRRHITHRRLPATTHAPAAVPRLLGVGESRDRSTEHRRAVRNRPPSVGCCCSASAQRPSRSEVT